MSSVYISHEGSYSLSYTHSSEVERSILTFAEMTPGSNHTLVISRKGMYTSCARKSLS